MEDLLRAAFKQMSTSPFDNSVLVRELKILKEIAKQHELLPLFEALYKKQNADGERILPSSVLL